MLCKVLSLDTKVLMLQSILPFKAEKTVHDKGELVITHKDGPVGPRVAGPNVS